VNTFEAIEARRSIRRFRPTGIERSVVERVLEAGIRAPSGKNRQPWRFVVLSGEARTHLADLIERSCEAIRAEGGDAGSAPATARIIRQAPVTIMVFATEMPEEWKRFEATARRVDIQSVGAAIQNMCLAAVEIGLGSLWIADVLYAEEAICTWLARPGEDMVAALSLGVPDEVPDARSRKPLDHVTEWMSEIA